MSRLVAETCDFQVSIPMHGKLNSLNASAAAAIKCTRLGARYGMANDEECRAFLQERGVTL